MAYEQCDDLFCVGCIVVLLAFCFVFFVLLVFFLGLDLSKFRVRYLDLFFLFSVINGF